MDSKFLHSCPKETMMAMPAIYLFIFKPQMLE
jgi:hypothetical protein